MKVARYFWVAAVAIMLAGSLASMAEAQVIVPPEPANLLDVLVDADVRFDGSSGLYVYSYRFTSLATSTQEVWFFAIRLTGSVAAAVQNPTSPPGWAFSSQTGGIITWAATDVGPLPPDFVDDGNVVPSPFQLKPGQTLGGFGFQSPDPPDTVSFFAEGFTKLPQVTGDVEELPQAGQDIPDFTQNSFIGTTSGPVSIAGRPPFRGGRRPAVDGFLVFANISKGETKNAPVAIVINFSQNGEQVDRTTFHASLNGIDVTQAFQPGGSRGDLIAVFDLGSSPLQVGRNVLITSVEGVVPGTTRTASDVDRLTFTVVK